MTCEECGATWRRSARFCGRCGAILRAEPRADDAPRRRATPILSRRIVAVVAAGCLVVLGGVALAVGEPWDALQATPSQDVEVPPSPEGTLPEDGDRPGADWEPPAPAVLCQPAPCERWRVHLPTGTTVVDGATAYHVGSTNWRTEVTAVDVDTGAVRWRRTLVVPDAVNGATYDGPSPTLLTSRPDVIVVAVEGRVEARSRSDGGLVWALELDGLLPFWLEDGPDDTIVTFAGLRHGGSHPGPGWSTEMILSLDADTGAPRWERTITMPLAFDPIPDGVIVAVIDPHEDPTDESEEPQGRPEDGSTLIALDASSGETLWERPLPNHGFGTSGRVLHIHDGAGGRLFDLETGEPLDLPITDLAVEDVHVEVLGDLVLVRSYPDNGPGPQPEAPLQHLAVFDPADGVELFSDSAPGWVGAHPLPDGGVVIGSGDDHLLRLTAILPDAGTRWTLELDVPSTSEWPRWPQVHDDGTITVIAAVAPDVPDLAAHRLDAHTGQILETFHLDIDVDTVFVYDLEVRWPVVINHDPDGTGVRLHGPAGSLATTQHLQVLSVDPLVVRTPSGTLARFDEGLLIGAP
jgi:outer membrane protein assembly factor BamB